jgi:hypothetical protein
MVARQFIAGVLAVPPARHPEGRMNQIPQRTIEASPETQGSNVRHGTASLSLVISPAMNCRALFRSPSGTA